jgi:hypothetical protein
MKKSALFFFIFISLTPVLISQNKIFVAHRTPYAIDAFDFGGVFLETIVSDQINSISLHWNPLDNKLYFSNFEFAPPRNYAILRCNLDGSDRDTIVTSPTSITDLSLDLSGEKIYWVSVESKSFYRCNFDGSAVETLFSTPESDPVSLSIDTITHKIYWMSYGPGAQKDKIHRANLDGSSREVIVDSLNTPARLLVYKDKIYWTNDVNPTLNITRANLDGANIEVVKHFSGESHPYAFKIDPRNDMIYWTDTGLHTVSSMSLSDTTTLEVLISEGIRTPTGLALAFDSETNTHSRFLPPPFDLFPNPASDFIHLNEISTQILDFQIFDIQGKLVKKQSRLDGSKIFIGDLEKGLYILNLRENAHSWSVKFVKN